MPQRSWLLAVLLLGLAVGSAHADITTGLVARYRMDGNANDTSGNGNHGTIVGSLVSTTDRFGNPNSAYEFDGTSTYISVPNSASLSSPSTACTQAAWIMLYGNSKVGTTTFAPITMKSVDATNAFMYRMYVETPTGIGASFNNWTIGGLTTGVFPPTEWHHVATVFNGSSLKYYRDGVLVSTTALALTITADARPLTIGADFPGTQEYFWGKMDDVRIYNRALTDNDMLELSSSGPTAVSSGSTPGFYLGTSVPNPSNGESRVEFRIESPQAIHLDVYDVAGRRVRMLESGARPAGQYWSNWDGRMDDGHQAPSGVYFFRLQAGKLVTSSRIVRVR